MSSGLDGSAARIVVAEAAPRMKGWRLLSNPAFIIFTP